MQSDLFFKSFRELLEIAKIEERTTINGVLQELNDVEPFSACGYFNVDKSLLTSILGTFINCFIILYQTVTCGPEK